VNIPPRITNDVGGGGFHPLTIQLFDFQFFLGASFGFSFSSSKRQTLSPPELNYASLNCNTMPKRKTAQPKRKAKSNATSKRGRKALRDIENEDRGEKDRAAAGGGEAINRVAKKRTRRGTEPAEVKVSQRSLSIWKQIGY